MNVNTHEFIEKKLSMWLIKLFVVLETLTGRVCLSKIEIEISKPDGFAELEDAAINILTNCYANEDKTIVLVGDFPESFSRRLSSHQSFALALLDNRRRKMNNLYTGWGDLKVTMRKVHIFVMITSTYDTYHNLVVETMSDSPFFDNMGFVLVIGWSRENKYSGCVGEWDPIDFLYNFNTKRMPNANLMCRDYTKGIVMYSSNPFGKLAPEPWRFVKSLKLDEFPHFSTFTQEYREDKGMCKNLHFDKTRDLGGTPIEIIRRCVMPFCTTERFESQYWTRQGRLQNANRWTFIENFYTYVNGTRVDKWVPFIKGVSHHFDTGVFDAQPKQLKGIKGVQSFVYTHGVECKFLISQFRGNKSQLEKIISVIDNYSWYGMLMVYIITLIFFKYFLHQHLLVGILNLFRLTCNFGLTTLPPNVAPRIYLGCLLFFVVIMQGIFVGNLAVLLTEDVPIRQVDSVQDLADLGYTVYVPKKDLIYFNESIAKSRLITLLPNVECVPFVLDNPMTACLEWGADALDAIPKYNLHRSPGCLITEYVTNTVPWKWMFEERLNYFLGIVISGSIMTSLDSQVDEARLLEAESEKVSVEPRIMVFDDLAFAFEILGIGLGFSTIIFIIEKIIYRFHRRVKTTRVVVLK